MRDYAIVVPEDCAAANTEEEKAYAFKLMKDVLKAHTRESSKLDWDGVSLLLFSPPLPFSPPPLLILSSLSFTPPT